MATVAFSKTNPTEPLPRTHQEVPALGHDGLQTTVVDLVGMEANVERECVRRKFIALIAHALSLEPLEMYGAGLHSKQYVVARKQAENNQEWLGTLMTRSIAIKRFKHFVPQ